MAELPRPLPPPTWRDRLDAAGLRPDRLPTAAIVAGLVVAILAAVVVTTIATGGPGRLGGGSGPDVALSLPQATVVTAATPGDFAPSTTLGGPLHVHAAGAVARPGVVEVPAGARVSDVVTAAGGAAGDANLDLVNLAAPVKDGERIYIPRHGEATPAVVASSSGAHSGGGDTSSAIVNINEADQAALETLPGVGPATAKAILDYRTEHGRFRSVDDLLNVRGIGPSKLEQIKPFARV